MRTIILGAPGFVRELVASVCIQPHRRGTTLTMTTPDTYNKLTSRASVALLVVVGVAELLGMVWN